MSTIKQFLNQYNFSLKALLQSFLRSITFSGLISVTVGSFPRVRQKKMMLTTGSHIHLWFRCGRAKFKFSRNTTPRYLICRHLFFSKQHFCNQATPFRITTNLSKQRTGADLILLSHSFDDKVVVRKSDSAIQCGHYYHDFRNIKKK